MKTIVDVISTRLNTAGTGTIYTATSGNVWYDEAPQDTSLPLMVWSFPNGFAKSPVFGASVFTATLEAKMFADKVSTTPINTLATALATSLDRWNGVSGTVLRVATLRTVCGVPSFEDDVWTITERYSVTAYLSTA